MAWRRATEDDTLDPQAPVGTHAPVRPRSPARRWLVGLTAGLVGLMAVPYLARAATRERPEGSFLSVSMPDDVQEEHGVLETPVGSVEHHTLRATEGDTELSITASTFSPAVLDLTTPGLLYRKARHRLVAEYGGEVTGWTECTHAGHECRKLDYTAKGGRRGLARLYLDEDTMVIVNAVYADDPKIARRFLASAQ